MIGGSRVETLAPFSIFVSILLGKPTEGSL